jgi:hypothetical protein
VQREPEATNRALDLAFFDMKTILAVFVVMFCGSLVHAQTLHPAIVKTNVAILNRARTRASVPLQLTRPAAEFHALVKEGDQWKAAPGILSHSGGSTNLEIEPNRVYFLGQRAPARPVASKQPVTNGLLSSSLVLMGKSVGGPASSHTEIVSGNLFIRSAREPVTWDAGAKAYQVELKIGFDSTNSAQALQQLFPLAVQLLGSNVSLLPDLIRIKEPGPSGYQTATVRSVKYTTQALVIAHYEGTDQATDQICPLQIEKLGILGMVNLLFPMTLLFATVAGGCAGGTLRMFKLRRTRRAQWYWLLPEGILVGLVFVAALSAGLGSATGVLSSSVVGHEAGAFAIAALTGFLGTAALDYFTKNLFASP